MLRQIFVMKLAVGRDISKYILAVVVLNLLTEFIL